MNIVGEDFVCLRITVYLMDNKVFVHLVMFQPSLNVIDFREKPCFSQFTTFPKPFIPTIRNSFKFLVQI